MSLEALDAILARLVLDRNFREQLRSDPETVLEQYDLTPDQRSVLLRLRRPKSGDGADDSGRRLDSS